MSDLEIRIDAIRVTMLRCPSCGYERMMQCVYDPTLDFRCPNCSDPGRWAKWSAKSGATAVNWKDTP